MSVSFIPCGLTLGVEWDLLSFKAFDMDSRRLARGLWVAGDGYADSGRGAGSWAGKDGAGGCWSCLTSMMEFVDGG